MAKEPEQIESAREEIDTVPVEAQPLPDSLGLTHTSSPVEQAALQMRRCLERWPASASPSRTVPLPSPSPGVHS